MSAMGEWRQAEQEVRRVAYRLRVAKRAGKDVEAGALQRELNYWTKEARLLRDLARQECEDT